MRIRWSNSALTPEYEGKVKLTLVVNGILSLLTFIIIFFQHKLVFGIVFLFHLTIYYLLNQQSLFTTNEHTR